MNSVDSNEYAVRMEKLKSIRESGVNPYPGRYERTHTTLAALEEGKKSKLRDPESILKKPIKKTIKLCGRLLSFRGHGRLSFGHLQDFYGKIQICFMEDLLKDKQYKFLKKIDVADFIGVEGELFLTRHGEVTLLVYKVILLSKALRPLPEKWHGIVHQEQIYRQRYLDTTTSRESLEKFIFRSNP